MKMLSWKKKGAHSKPCLEEQTWASQPEKELLVEHQGSTQVGLGGSLGGGGCLLKLEGLLAGFTSVPQHYLEERHVRHGDVYFRGRVSAPRSESQRWRGPLRRSACARYPGLRTPSSARFGLQRGISTATAPSWTAPLESCSAGIRRGAVLEGSSQVRRRLVRISRIWMALRLKDHLREMIGYGSANRSNPVQ